MWEIMIGDRQLAKIIFEHLLEVIALTLPYQEKDFGGTITRTETHTPKAVSDVSVNSVFIPLPLVQEIVAFLYTIY